MFQNNKKLPVIMVAAVIFSITSNWKYFFGDKKKTSNKAMSAAQASKTVASKQAAVASAEQQKKAVKKVPKKTANLQRMLELASEADWKMDFFGGVLKRETTTESSVAPPPKKKKKTKLRLESILITQLQPLAVVNGRLLAEGDSIMGKKILKITENSIVVQEKGTIEELRIKDAGITTTYVETSVAEEKTQN